jgi:hypothetical protein
MYVRTAHVTAATAARSQFWSQLSSFVTIRRRPNDRFPSADGDLRICLDRGLRIWKRVGFTPSRVRIPHPPRAGKQGLTCGNAPGTLAAGASSDFRARFPSVHHLASRSGLAWCHPLCRPVLSASWRMIWNSVGTPSEVVTATASRRYRVSVTCSSMLAARSTRLVKMPGA